MTCKFFLFGSFSPFDLIFSNVNFFLFRNLKEREKVLHERKQSVEQIIQWRRKLEEEERRLRDVERQAHTRHRSTLGKHMLRGKFDIFMYLKVYSRRNRVKLISLFFRSQYITLSVPGKWRFGKHCKWEQWKWRAKYFRVSSKW